jgi:hypothetical protein
VYTVNVLDKTHAAVDSRVVKAANNFCENVAVFKLVQNNGDKVTFIKSSFVEKMVLPCLKPSCFLCENLKIT